MSRAVTEAQWNKILVCLSEAYGTAMRINGGFEAARFIQGVKSAVVAWRDYDLVSLDAEDAEQRAAAVDRVEAAVKTVEAGLAGPDVSYESGARYALEEIRKALAFVPFGEDAACYQPVKDGDE